MTTNIKGRTIFTHKTPTASVRFKITHCDLGVHPFQLLKSYSDGSIRHMGISNDAVRAMYAALKEEEAGK